MATTTVVRTIIVNTPKRDEFDAAVASAIDELRKGAPIVSVSVAPIKQVEDGGDILTKRLLVTLVVEAEPEDWASVKATEAAREPRTPQVRRGR